MEMGAIFIFLMYFGGDQGNNVFCIFFMIISMFASCVGEEGCSLMEMEVIRKKVERREKHSSPSLFAPFFISQTISSSFPFHLFSWLPKRLTPSQVVFVF